MGEVKYRSLFVSDIHMGKSSGRHGTSSDVVPFLKFIKNKQFEYVYLLGDIFDFWELTFNWKWDRNFNLFILEILKMLQGGTKITYIIGNHDDWLNKANGFDMGGIPFQKEVLHTTAKNKKFLITHGQLYDPVNKFSGLFRKLTYLLPGVSWFTWRMVEWTHIIFAKTTRKTKEQHHEAFRERIMKQCYRKNLDGVICGHFHIPTIITMKKGKIYINTGDSCSNFTLVTENQKGNFKLHKLDN